MIMDVLQQSKRYSGIHPKLGEALDYLRTQPLASMEPGKYDIQGEDMFLLLQSYDTRPAEEGFWEAHRIYTDVQYMVRGAEKMGYAHVDSLTLVEDRLADNDYAVFTGQGNEVTVREGEFVVFFPHDAHMPCLAAGEPERIRKAVIKVRL